MPTDADRLQDFLDAAEAAFTERATDPRAQASVTRCFSALGSARDAGPGAGSRLAVCDAQLDAALGPCRSYPPALARLADAFRSVEPSITWRRRGGSAPNASANFEDGHANGMVVGPGGIERRGDVWLGVSLLAPHVRYPDHSHPPEETYLVLSAGEFRQADGPWFAPGPGGSFYNPPGILHAMRSGPAPLLAFWLLRPDPAVAA